MDAVDLSSHTISRCLKNLHNILLLITFDICVYFNKKQKQNIQLLLL